MSEQKNYSLGNTPVPCIYQTAVVLSMLEGTLVVDHSSEFWRTLHALCNTAWDALPELSILFPPED